MRGTAAYALMIGTMLLALGGRAQAVGEVLIEDVSAPRPGLETMDYLQSGQMIMLGAGDRLVLNYLRSCNRETIVGGVVSIGAEQSIVSGGTVAREKVECAGGKSLLTSEQASQSGVMVFRGKPRLRAAAPAN